jgi:hypothetical protein
MGDKAAIGPLCHQIREGAAAVDPNLPFIVFCH